MYLNLVLLPNIKICVSVHSENIRNIFPEKCLKLFYNPIGIVSQNQNTQKNQIWNVHLKPVLSPNFKLLVTRVFYKHFPVFFTKILEIISWPN